MKPTRAKTPLTQFKARSFIIHEPMGNTLIMSPWNYPLQLTMVPLAGAIAGGNTAVIKPSRYSQEVSKVMKSIIDETFSDDYIALFEGGHETNTALLDQRWDFIFFTGSPNIGKIVHQAAGKYLTPCILELGGKSPVIIDGTVNMELTARRLAWGKYLNAGQTCVAPDYALVKKGYAEPLIKALKKEIEKMFTSVPFSSSDYPKIINQKPFYIFSRNRKDIDKALSSISFGGGCVNDTVVHLTAPELPFGGIGNSGMGCYHGKRSFEAFTHDKAIMDKALWLDLRVRYAPFKGKLKLVKMLMR